MDTGSALARISCGRCQSKKIRCNRVTPPIVTNVKLWERIVSTQREKHDPRKKTGIEELTNYRRPEISEKRLLLEVLSRLKRLEEHCGLENVSNTRTQGNGDDDDSMSISSSVESDDDRNMALVQARDTPNTSLPVADIPIPITLVPAVIHNVVSRIKDEGSRSMLLSNVFCHLRSVESCFFENEQCIRAVTSAMLEIDFMQSTQEAEPLRDPVIPKDLARKFIENYYDCYQYEGFKVPLEKSFLSSIPDLIESPHVKLDFTVQIIYYAVLLQGIVLDPDAYSGNRGIIRNLYLKCVALSEDWLANIQDTPADLFAALSMISMALEGCNTDLSWKAFSQACRISKVLGYFTIDETPLESPNQHQQQQQSHLPAPESQSQSHPETTPHETEIEKNRKRFEFWHILRTDSLFRTSFGKPTLIPPGSWAVNFPDTTIIGIDSSISRFIQIHFLASMRLALIVMKYLDWIDSGTASESEPESDVSHDTTIDGFINEVQSILLDWDTESLLQIATNHVDIWFCVDILFSSYKMLIILYQSKRCNRGRTLPAGAVTIARKSVTKFRALLGVSMHAFWGISIILLHQFVPFFILCLDILGNPDHECLDEDLSLVSWLSEYVAVVVEERVELRPILIIIRAMVTACEQTRMDRLCAGE
ncbi:hypothetical protein N7533_008742 [Penicillium manginii]|uniref:uncharacterized protein n=1 Tax=Penicillium manginii TaxID=203109 RepID=UPI0025471DEA|nr:uncharacterized protein N7533_008742 [Penicillium manginii]KAJ5743872.1 hypothetical protein N7533_008742 [Penicillium manginii]